MTEIDPQSSNINAIATKQPDVRNSMGKITVNHRIHNCILLFDIPDPQDSTRKVTEVLGSSEHSETCRVSIFLKQAVQDPPIMVRVSFPRVVDPAEENADAMHHFYLKLGDISVNNLECRLIDPREALPGVLPQEQKLARVHAYGHLHAVNITYHKKAHHLWGLGESVNLAHEESGPSLDALRQLPEAGTFTVYLREKENFPATVAHLHQIMESRRGMKSDLHRSESIKNSSQRNDAESWLLSLRTGNETPPDAVIKVMKELNVWKGD